MPVYFESSVPVEKLTGNIGRRVYNLENLMVVVCDFTNGPAAVPDPPHSHPHEQITYVAEGELFFFMDKEKFHLSKADIYSVPSGIPHCIQTISPFVRLIDSFTPLREEFIKK